MRATRYSRGGRSSNGRFRGSSGGRNTGSRFVRHRQPSLERTTNYRVAPVQSYSVAYPLRHNHHYHVGEENHSRYHPVPQYSPHLEARERYLEYRYKSPVQMMVVQSPSVEENVHERTSRKRDRTPRETHGRTRRRVPSPSPVLSDISSGSSFFGEVVDSDAYASPDYDELTSEEEEIVDEEEQEEEVLEETVKRKKRKKEKKRKEREKEKEKERKQRKREKKRKKEIMEERICPPEHDVAQSKEIFSSGKNILVSVSFADGDAEERREQAEKNHRKAKKKKASRKKSKTGNKPADDNYKMKHDDSGESASANQKKKRKLDENIKPVAIIDLDRSPGKQVISSPKEVIVLSDEEGGNKAKNKPATDQVGPNTPPEPAPKSPESYDPFDPTKSSTQSPLSGHNIGSISTVSYPEHHHLHHLHHHSHQRQLKDAHLAMSHTSLDLNSAGGDHYDDSVLDLHPSSPMDQLSPRGLYRQSPLKSHRPTVARKPGHPSVTATTTSGATVPGATAAVPPPPFGDDMEDGDISPYSPRSSDCDDHMFDPPPEGEGMVANGNSGQQPKTIALTVDNLRKVFGNDKKTLYGDLRRPNEAVVMVDEMYKPQKITLEMLDDIPNSAVDLQIKEKLIQKLQRQERIIEEVKHFLKPHFNKKRLNKDEYKDIMKKSVPKICHSRSGEINPAKIQNLITAYVKKAIAKRRLGASGGNAIVSSTTAVT
ncbi:general transcriptional corepressor trfA-like [Toxorhynchites rutilus septentrionalis]|uniref:general transcriptional corepressor trfA-like n=1 Tax=Toxorhynchites rutilus septentrionalis TaxID=329112 RepID=UPI00247A8795|nr:general transcriptional corepressor trfA-like [Toxorhynchites rutilus septentrionalis]